MSRMCAMAHLFIFTKTISRLTISALPAGDRYQVNASRGNYLLPVTYPKKISFDKAHFVCKLA